MNEIKLQKKYYSGEDIINAILAHMNTIAALPAADVKPVVRGEWIRRDDSIFAKCPNCGCEVNQIKNGVFRDGKGHIDFCPNCGADMREVQG